MHPDERAGPRPADQSETERPVRVLDGGRFTFAAPAEVRRPRFLDAGPSLARAPAGSPGRTG